MKPWQIALLIGPVVSIAMRLLIAAARRGADALMRPGFWKELLFKERRNPFDLIRDAIANLLLWPLRWIGRRRLRSTLEHPALRDLREREAAWRAATRGQ